MYCIPKLLVVTVEVYHVLHYKVLFVSFIPIQASKRLLLLVYCSSFCN